MMIKLRILSVLVLSAIFVGFGCGGKTQPTGPRTDIAPIQKRFSKITGITKTFWVGGALGKTGGLLPAPTDVYYRGFMWLSSDEASRLRGILGQSSSTSRITVDVLPQDQSLWAGGVVGAIDLSTAESFSSQIMPPGAHGTIGFVAGQDVIYFDLKGR